MSIKKSRNYTQDDGSKVSFQFKGGKIIGVKKDGVSINPNTSEFSDFTQSEDGIYAYNINKYTSAKKSYEKTSQSLTSAELNAYYTTESKKETNEAFIEENSNSVISFSFSLIIFIDLTIFTPNS